MNELKALNSYLWKYRMRFIAGLFFIAASNYFQSSIPAQVRKSIDLVFKAVSESTVNQSTIQVMDVLAGPLGWSVSAIILFAFIQGLFMFFMRQTIVVMSRKIEYDLKNQMYNQYQKLSLSFYKRNTTGDLMSRISEDVNRVRDYLGPALMYVANLTILIPMVIIHMLSVSPLLTLFVLIPLPILSFSIYKVNSIVNNRSTAIQEKLSDITSFTQEAYSGIRVVKSYSLESELGKTFEKDSEDYKNKVLRMTRVEALWFPLITLLIGISNLLTLCIGGILEIKGSISTGTIAEFMLYVNMITFPVSALGWASSIIQRANVSQRRINQFLQEPTEIVSGNTEVSLKGATISFKNVTYQYPDTGIEALKDLNLEIQSGEKIAIVGRTGSGKSTLAEILVRMFDPTEGKILIGGVDIKDINLGSLRTQTAYVPQEVFLFSDTIMNNIGFGISPEELSEETVIQAAKASSIHQEIMEFPENYQTIVGERGVTLSGGQKQRISIARALAKQPNLVVLDDCLSAVDAQTEKRILANLYQFLEGKTSIMITHRIFGIMDFDKIIVLHEGRLVEAGTHEELIQHNGYYKSMFDKQQLNEEPDEQAA